MKTLPDWRDDGRRVVRLKDGKVGTITTEELFDGENEWPLSNVRMDNGDDDCILDEDDWEYEGS